MTASENFVMKHVKMKHAITASYGPIFLRSTFLIQTLINHILGNHYGHKCETSCNKRTFMIKQYFHDNICQATRNISIIDTFKIHHISLNKRPQRLLSFEAVSCGA